MESITKFAFIRHGETLWNVERRWQGHLDIPLNAIGQQQAAAVAQRMVNHSFSHLYSSDLQRTYQTAAAIAALTGHTILTEERIRERNLGIFQGLTQEEMETRFPDEFQLNRAPNPHYVIPQGESQQQFFDRTTQCLHDLAQRHIGESVVVVTHGGVLDCLFRFALGLPLETPRRFSLLNVSLNMFTIHDGFWKLEYWGDVAHLDTLGSLDESSIVKNTP